VDLIDPQTLQVLCPLYPLDKAANADGLRRTLSVDPALPNLPVQSTSQPGLPPLLRKMMADFAATGKPPAYIPMMDKEFD
jgi:putative transposase